MAPMRTSWIFKSRWLALAFAAGIIWFALSVGAPGDEAASASDNQVQITDASGTPISPQEARRLEEALKNL